MNSNPFVNISDDQPFEELCCAVAQHKFGDYSARKYGRNGQSQWGVDVIATDRRGGDEKVVIQCKFKTIPPAFKSKKKKEVEFIRKEIDAELKKALAGEKKDFDHFIYASNIPRDTVLDKIEEEFSTSEYRVSIWSMAEIEEEVRRSPRLTQLYTLRGDKHGVDLINRDFIDFLDQEKEKLSPNIFRFYTGSKNNYTQWYGITENWDIVRSQYTAVYEKVVASYSDYITESRIVALILGEGGCGKSVFLRRLAMDLAKKEEDIVVWWLTDLRIFYERDLGAIDDTPHCKHLLIIEDWYRNVRGDRSFSQPIFAWASKLTNVKIVIGDREVNKGYRRHINASNTFEITNKENQHILDGIAKKLPSSKLNFEALLAQENLIQNSPIFIVLFVLAEAIEGKFDIAYDKLNFEREFVELIGRKIAVLENDERYTGIGKALYLCAVIYSDPQSSYYAVNKSAFFIMAESLGNNKELVARVSANQEIPRELQNFVAFNRVRHKSGADYIRTYFNHDLLAEKGISLIENSSYALDFKIDNFEVLRIVKKCIAENELNTAFSIYLWLYLKFKTLTIDDFFELFSNGLRHLSNIGYGVFLGSHTKKDQIEISKRILEKEEFYKFAPVIVSHALRVLRNEVIGKQKSKEIMNLPFFYRLPNEIVSIALRVLEYDEFGKLKCQEILELKEFYKLPSEIISHALRILQKEELGKLKCQEILEQEKFYELPKEMVSHALRILDQEEFGKLKCREILEQKEFFKLPDDIVSHALRILQKEEFGKLKCQEILEQEKFYRLSKEIVSHALRILQDEELGKEKSKEILELDNFHKLPFEIVSHALRIWKDEPLGRQKSKVILEQKDFYRLPFQIVSHSLRIWQEHPIGRQKAEMILKQEQFYLLPFQLVAHSLRIWQDKALGRQKSKEILEQDQFYKLPADIVSHALRILQDDAFGKLKSKEILEQDQFYKLPADIVSHALRILQDDAFGKLKSKEILEQPQFYRLSIKFVSHALRILQDEELGRRKSKEILETKDFCKLPGQIVSLALGILQDEELGKKSAMKILVLFTSNKVNNAFLILRAMKNLFVYVEEVEIKEFLSTIYYFTTAHLNTRWRDRLFFDLLYLPYYFIPEHMVTVRKVMNSYATNLDIKKKSNLHRVLHCIKEYNSHVPFDYDSIVRTVSRSWKEDLQYQIKNKFIDIFDGHIATAISCELSKEFAVEYAKEIVEFIEPISSLKQQALYKTANAILTEEDFEFW